MIVSVDPATTSKDDVAVAKLHSTVLGNVAAPAVSSMHCDDQLAAVDGPKISRGRAINSLYPVKRLRPVL